MENLTGMRSELFNREEFQNLSFLENRRQQISLMSKLQASGQNKLLRSLNLDLREGLILNGRALAGVTARDVNRARAYSAGSRLDILEFAGIEDPRDVTANQYVRMLAAKKGISGSLILSGKEKEIFKGLEDGTITGNRALVAINTGVDIGNFANSVSEEEAMRIGMLERDLGLSLEMRSPENMFKAGLLEKSGFYYNGLVFTGVGKARSGQSPFPGTYKHGEGKYFEMEIDGRKITLPRGKESFNALNDVALRSNLAMRSIIKTNSQLSGYQSSNYNNFATRATGSFNAFAGISATAAFQVPESVNFTPQWRRQQIHIEDQNRNKLRTGGIRNPDFPLWDPRAVEGGFTSISTYRANWWRQLYAKSRSAEKFLEQLGIDRPKYVRKSTLGKIVSHADTIRSLMSRAGLKLSSLPSIYKVQRGGRRWVSQSLVAQREAVLRQNQANYSKADEIVSLIEDYGLPQFFGSGSTEAELQAKMQEQDDLFRSMGLARTEAFKIIDSSGRGREEIDDRILWMQRNTSMSTGVAVI